MISFEQFTTMVNSAPDLKLLYTFAREAPSMRTAGFVDMEGSANIGGQSASDSDDTDSDEEMLSSKGSVQQAEGNSTTSLPAGVMLPPTAAVAAPTGPSARVPSISDPKPPTPTSSPNGLAPSPPQQPVVDSNKRGLGFVGLPPINTNVDDGTALPAATSPKPAKKDPNEGSIVEIVAAPPFLEDTSGPLPMEVPTSPIKKSRSASSFGDLGKRRQSKIRRDSEGTFVWGDFGGAAAGSCSSSSDGFRTAGSHVDDDELQEETLGEFTYKAPKTEAKAKPTAAAMMGSSRRLSMSLKSCDELEDDPTEEEESNDVDNGDFLFGDFVVSRSDSEDDIGGSDSRIKDADGPAEMFMFGDFVIPGMESSPPKPAAKQTPGPSSITPQSTKPVEISKLLAKGEINEVKETYFIGHSGRIKALQFGSAREDCIISCGGDETPILRGAKDKTPVRQNELLTMYSFHTDKVLFATVTIDYKYVAFCSNDSTLSVFEVATTKKCAHHHHSFPVICAAFSRNGKYVMSGCQDGVCRLWTSRKTSKAPIATYLGHKAYVSALMFQPNGEIVASASGDKTVHLWNGATSKTIRIIKTHKFPVGAVDFTANGKVLLSVCKQHVVLTHISDGACLFKVSPSGLRVHYGFDSTVKFTAAAFCPQSTPSSGSTTNTPLLHIAIATSVKTFSFHTVNNLPEETDNSTEKPLGELKSLASANVKDLSSVSSSTSVDPAAVSIGPSVWDTMMRNSANVIVSGRTAMLVGDTGGNVLMLDIK